MNKEAKFFCENCGEEVAQNAKFCKKCGRFFSSVRCPKCGKVGSAHAFAKGCPQCGYAEKPSKTSSKNSASSKSSSAKSHFYFHKPKSAVTNSTKKKTYNSSSLPLWIYGITLGLLVVMIILFMRCSY